MYWFGFGPLLYWRYCGNMEVVVGLRGIENGSCEVLGKGGLLELRGDEEEDAAECGSLFQYGLVRGVGKLDC